MANQDDAQAVWLPVIGKALVYLCLQDAQRREPEKLDSVLKRVKFLEALGLRRNDAAEVAGSSAASVQVLHSLSKSKKAKNGEIWREQRWPQETQSPHHARRMTSRIRFDQTGVVRQKLTELPGVVAALRSLAPLLPS